MNVLMVLMLTLNPILSMMKVFRTVKMTMILIIMGMGMAIAVTATAMTVFLAII